MLQVVLIQTLWKIRPFVQKLHETCQEMYSTHRQISVNESMIGTKCRLIYSVHAQKLVKWVWVCSDSINGYISSFDIYTGKDPSHPNHPKGLAYEVVIKLVEPFLNKGYVVYTISKRNQTRSVEKPLAHLCFRLQLVYALTAPLVGLRRGPGRMPMSQEKRLIGKHFPYFSTVKR